MEKVTITSLCLSLIFPENRFAFFRITLEDHSARALEIEGTASAA